MQHFFKFTFCFNFKSYIIKPTLKRNWVNLIIKTIYYYLLLKLLLLLLDMSNFNDS